MTSDTPLGLKPGAIDPLDIPPGARSAADAWAIVQAHHGLAVFLATRLCRPGNDLEDLCQEALLGLHDAAVRHDSSRSDNFPAFARIWIRGRISTAQRRRRVRVQAHAALGPDDDRPAPAPHLEPDELARLHAAIDALPARQQTAIREHYLRGRQIKDIAALLGRTPNMVSMHHRAALAALRRTLEGTVAPPRAVVLTEREVEVLERRNAGLTAPQIAAQLGIGRSRVSRIEQHARAKLAKLKAI